MISLPARILLFIGSYVPLGFIILVLYIGQDNAVALLALAACLVGIGGTGWILRSARTSVNAISRTVEDVREPGDGIMGYVATYLVPFVGFPLGPIREDLAFLILLFVLAYLYVTTDMLHVNPLLRVFGYHVYEVTFASGFISDNSSSKQVQYLLAKGPLSRNNTVIAAKFRQGIWIEGAKP